MAGRISEKPPLRASYPITQRRVLTRWEKKIENYEAMLHFSCGIIVWSKSYWDSLLW
ncbi:hypothetical protein KAM481_15030 [Aeromonas caviae]|nr:hypothetical protein KAM481_15030 [Aeromonas caviae]